MGLGVAASTTSSVAGRSLTQHQVLDPPTSHNIFAAAITSGANRGSQEYGEGEGRNRRCERQGEDREPDHISLLRGAMTSPDIEASENTREPRLFGPTHKGSFR